MYSIQIRGGATSVERCTESILRLAPFPSNVSSIQAAGFTLTGLTVYQALIHWGKLEECQRVFMNSGSSSVGAFAIHWQITIAMGCKVTTSASAKNGEFVRSLGADEVLTFVSRESS
jgi:NADPH:quinone reductase-like Zn-dependent oxidoreductase